MFHDNLVTLRKMKNMTQEDIAEKIGVSRQSVAKWETGETVPDLDKCKILAEIFEVSLDDLANYESEANRKAKCLEIKAYDYMVRFENFAVYLLRTQESSGLLYAAGGNFNNRDQK